MRRIKIPYLTDAVYGYLDKIDKKDDTYIYINNKNNEINILIIYVELR